MTMTVWQRYYQRKYRLTSWFLCRMLTEYLLGHQGWMVPGSCIHTAPQRVLGEFGSGPVLASELVECTQKYVNCSIAQHFIVFIPFRLSSRMIFRN